MGLTLQDQAALDNWERLWLDPEYDTATHRYREPLRCASCNSVETEGARCSWCHSELEE